MTNSSIINSAKTQPVLSGLLFKARSMGYGQGTRQKYTFTNVEMAELECIMAAWSELSTILQLGALTSTQVDILHRKLIASVRYKRSIHIATIFCPSYRLGECRIGYNREIGSSTLRNLNALAKVVAVFNRAGIYTSVTIYFSDILLENYDALQGTNYLDDLQANFDSLQRHLPEDGFEAIRLSSLGRLADQVGDRGTISAPIEASSSDLDIVEQRNAAFYSAQLGWADHQTRERTEMLARNYPLLAEAVSAKHPESIYYWSESAFERFRLMPNMSLPVMFPKHEVSE